MYIVDFDTDTIKKEYYDVIIIGSGIAGVYTALQLRSYIRTAIITKESIDISNSVLAQGGIAVSLDKSDSPKLHFDDTLYAGAGVCEQEAVWVLVNEAAENIETLCRYGVNFDRGEDQKLSLTREAAHSVNRIIHTGDATGKEVCDTLVKAVKARSNVEIIEKTFIADLLVKGNKCLGVLTINEDTDEMKIFTSKLVICASGGYGQLYSNTTNPEVATGDGLAFCYRAGAELVDMEFVQFHPTVLYHEKNKSFLISEAVRGEGAVLRNAQNEVFMEKYHELKELAPRDVVSRAIFREIMNTNKTNAFLDITHKEREYLMNRFPNIFKTCLQYGIDISKDYIPVAPAEHYSMGGIKTDEWGKTKVNGLYACGEAACNGIHGANRLASNSLLEGLVFGNRIAREINQNIDKTKRPSEIEVSLKNQTNKIENNYDCKALKKRLQEIMNSKAAIVRNKEGLTYALMKIQEIYETIHNAKNMTVEQCELFNMVQISKMVVSAALQREESRGAHYREDFTKTDDINWMKHIVFHNEEE